MSSFGDNPATPPTVSTAWFGFRNMTPANYFSTAAALGIGHVEVPLYAHRLDQWYGAGPVTPKDVVTLASDCGVTMVAAVANLALTPPFDGRGRPLSRDHAMTNRMIARLIIDIGQELGLSVIRIAEPDIAPGRQAEADRYMIDYGRALGPIGEYAAERGIVIAVENYGLSIDQMESLLTAADHPNVGTLFDPCNYARLNEDPVLAARRLKHQIVYCHLKDTASNETRDPTFAGSRYGPSLGIGEGDMNWSALLPELADGYGGYAAIEYEDEHSVVPGTRRGAAFLVAAGYCCPAPPRAR